MNEARYSRLTREFPERATELFANATRLPPRSATSTCSSWSRCTRTNRPISPILL